jgi:RimJ/RimL family protein N-acetyltransferase
MKMDVEKMTDDLMTVPFNPQDASEASWSAWFAVSESVFREFNPKSRLPDRGVAKRRLSVASPLYRTERFLVFDCAKTPVAVMSFGYETERSPSYELDKNIGYITIQVEKTVRRNRIASRLLRDLLGKARQMNKTAIVGEVDTTPGRKFCEAYTGEMVHKEVQHRMVMDDADWEEAALWRAKGRKKFPDTTFEFFQDCPAADIDAFCRTYTEIINERPTGDMQQTIITTPQSRRIEEENLKKKGVQWYTLISREKNGDISAMTDIMYHPREPHKITQYFTGVSARHRRKGLAKRLKAEMLYLMREKFPQVDYITTTMAPDNRPMQAINAKLGFKLRKTDYVYQWTLTDLERQVATRLQSAKRRRKRDCQTGSPG